MNTKYRYKIQTWAIILFIIAYILFPVAGFLHNFLYRDNLYGLVWLLYPVVGLFIFLKSPSAQISERNVLAVRGYYIKIDEIIALEESKKKLFVVFIYNEKERMTQIHVSDSDRQRLIADLKSLNPNIDVRNI